MGQQAGRFHSLSDSDLVDLLHTAGDELPREAVDEFLRRGARTLPLLHAVVTDKAAWTRPVPEWWAVVHATYILAAMQSEAALNSLLTALRWADAFDCDWVTEDLPSMLGQLGSAVHRPLRTIVDDSTAGAGARSIALFGLAAAALVAAVPRREVLETAASLVRDEGEELYLRQSAANVLLDFRSNAHRTLLRRFGKEEAARREEDPEYQGVFYDWEVDELLQGEGEASEALEYYRRDWLSFYDPEQLEQRRERWAREREEASDMPSQADPSPAARDLRAPCPCGSGRPFEACCYLKVH